MRTPKMDELHKVMELLAQFADEVGMDMEDFNVPKFRWLLRHGRHPDDSIYGAIIEDKGKFIGIIVGFLGTTWFSTEKLAMIGTLYVRPDYRGGPTALKLLRGFEKWAKNHHVTNIRFEADTGIMPDRTYKFIERLGYKEVGRIFTKEV